MVAKWKISKTEDLQAKSLEEIKSRGMKIIKKTQSNWEVVFVFKTDSFWIRDIIKTKGQWKLEDM